MRVIDTETWSRRQHYAFFKTYAHPHFGLCAQVDMTAFYPAVKQRGHSLTVSIVYVIARAANAEPAFRYRIQGEDVVEYDTVSPGFTILVAEDVFSFCIVDYVADFHDFAASAAAGIAAVQKDPWVSHPHRDDVLYTTAIPWVSFTDILHPMPDPPDAVPRIAWGKIVHENESLKMPLAVQGHHALMDGIHMAHFYEQVQTLLDRPEETLGQA